MSLEQEAREAAEFVGGEFIEIDKAKMVFRVNGRHIVIWKNGDRGYSPISYGLMKCHYPEYPSPIGPCVSAKTIISCLVNTIRYSRSPAMKEMISG